MVSEEAAQVKRSTGSGLTVASLPVREGEGRATLALSGELTAQTMYTLRDAISDCLRYGYRLIRLDLTNVSECEDPVPYSLMGLRQALHAAHGDLLLVAVSEPVEQAIAGSGIDCRFLM